MAENETLNLKDRHSGRWRALMRLVEQGGSVGQVREEAVRCLYAVAKHLHKLLPVTELLAAAGERTVPLQRSSRDAQWRATMRSSSNGRPRGG